MHQISELEPVTMAVALLSPAIFVQRETAATAPDGPGAYAVFMRFAGPVRFTLKGLTQKLPAGWYVYAGSAYGPGGIRARLRRHFRRDKKIHWHVDRLTPAAETLSAVAVPGGTECALVAQLTESGEFRHVLDGFGSSDCTTCRSHLLAWRGHEGFQ